ncbi:hypothetical protein ACQ4PT_036541 [Festuca glaucescens]
MGRQIHFGRNSTIRVCSKYWAKVKTTKAQPRSIVRRKIDETVQFVLFHFFPPPPSLLWNLLLPSIPPQIKPPTNITPQEPNPPAAPKATSEFQRFKSAPEMSADELRLDLEELRRLEGLATRPRVLSLLANEIRSVDAKMAAAPVPAAAAAARAGVSYVTLGTFSWDQDNDKIRVYIFLENVDQEKVETTFKPMSVDIKFHDVKGKNYRCAIPKLNKEIVPEKCKVVVKPTKIVITLWKASTGSWLDLHYKEDKFKPITGKDKDPMSGIMDLMKDLYEEGDDNMRRTIGQTMMDARAI